MRKNREEAERLGEPSGLSASVTLREGGGGGRKEVWSEESHESREQPRLNIPPHSLSQAVVGSVVLERTPDGSRAAALGAPLGYAPRGGRPKGRLPGVRM